MRKQRKEIQVSSDPASDSGNDRLLQCPVQDRMLLLTYRERKITRSRNS